MTTSEQEAPGFRSARPDGSSRLVRSSVDAFTAEVTVSGPTTSGLPPAIGTVTVAHPASTVQGFTSSWGLEFEPIEGSGTAPFAIEVTSGRSGNGAHPWLGIVHELGAVVVTVHWSGNWQLISTNGHAGTEIAVGLHPAGQEIALAAGESLALPRVSVAWGRDLTAAGDALVSHLAGQVPDGAPLLTEWNHWWPYEDAEITEDVFLANAAEAARLGLEVAVLDAGWFGPASADSAWYDVRGDWHQVNTRRFPHGLEWLAEQTRARGVDFGIWIEGEAVGARAEVARQRPRLIATDAEGAGLGYLCLGCPATADYLYDTVARIVRETEARWVKWDFNLDPGSGCARDDHGHRHSDGLLRHYLGLYRLFDRLRAAFPATVWESCSSGGLRIDPGLAAHVDAFFLSDPDWTEHHLSCLWGASRMLPARQILHWPQSEWRGEHRFQKVDYSGTLITERQFDTHIRAAMLHRFGVSIRLTELRPDLAERLTTHVRTFRDVIRPLLSGGGVLAPLGPQPRREERGHRLPAFQLGSPDELVVAAFRLPPAVDWDAVRLRGLDRASSYLIEPLDGPGESQHCIGGRLMATGLMPSDLQATSAMWRVRRS